MMSEKSLKQATESMTTIYLDFIFYNIENEIFPKSFELRQSQLYVEPRCFAIHIRTTNPFKLIDFTLLLFGE